MAKDFSYYFAQLRKIEDHREEEAQKEIRKMYKAMLKDTKNFVADEYYRLAEDGKLTYEILRAKMQDARFLAEVEQRLDGLSSDVSKSIRKTVEEMYTLAYENMVDAVEKSATAEELKKKLGGLRGVSAETLQAHINNPISGLTLSDTLERNRKNIIWDIKREIGVGLTMGDRYETMAKRIATSLDGDYKKAVRIVRTEAGRAREAGHLESANEINDTLKKGISGNRMVKTWKTMQDGKVRDQHGEMNGVTVEADDNFELPDGTTMPAPKQCSVASQVVNCRCFAKYDLMNDKEYFDKTGKHFKTMSLNEMPEATPAVTPSASKPIRSYVNADGTLNGEAVHDDYEAFLETVPAKYREVLRYAFQTTPIEKLNRNSSFGYSPSNQKIGYNLTSEAGQKVLGMPLTTTLTHELSHRIVDMYGSKIDHSPALKRAIAKSADIISEKMDFFVDYANNNDPEGFLTDILKSVKYDDRFSVGHDRDYLSRPGASENEIFANLLALSAVKDKEKVEFIKKNLPDLWKVFDGFDFEDLEI